MSITAIVLAAGRSTRFGRDNKLLADTGAGPLVHRVVSAVAESLVADIVLVTGLDSGRIAAAAGPGRWRIAANAHPSEGLSSSIRTGIAAVGPQAAGVLIVLADMPAVSAALIGKLIAGFEAKDKRAIVFPVSADGRQGHPVLWPRALFPDLMSLSGDTGGKALIQAHRDLLSPIQIEDAAAFLDIDTPADLQRYRDRQT